LGVVLGLVAERLLIEKGLETRVVKVVKYGVTEGNERRSERTGVASFDGFGVTSHYFSGKEGH
jgi:hypothetical protein